MSNVKSIVDGDTVTGSYPTGGTGNLPLDKEIIFPSGGRDARSMIQRAATAGYGRLLETVAGGALPPSRVMGNVQAGTSALLGSVHVGSFITFPEMPLTQRVVSGIMHGVMGRTTCDPFYKAMIGFNKKAKKFSKKI